MNLSVTAEVVGSSPRSPPQILKGLESNGAHSDNAHSPVSFSCRHPVRTIAPTSPTTLASKRNIFLNFRMLITMKSDILLSKTICQPLWMPTVAAHGDEIVCFQVAGPIPEVAVDKRYRIGKEFAISQGISFD
jgi:hypothetical protein